MYSIYCESDYDEYIAKMTKPGEWGDEMALKAVCDKMNIGVQPPGVYSIYAQVEQKSFLPQTCTAKVFLPNGRRVAGAPAPAGKCRGVGMA